MKRILGWLTLDHRSLGHQRLFWVAITLPAILFLYFGWFYWRDLDFQWNTEGFSNFITISKFPLTLLALILPFTALVTSWHRSIQTAKQIDEAQVKNTADLYYAHKKFFIEQLGSAGVVLNPLQFYYDKFPRMSIHSYDPTPAEKYLMTYQWLSDSYAEAHRSIDAASALSSLQATLATLENLLNAITQTGLIEKQNHILGLSKSIYLLNELKKAINTPDINEISEQSKSIFFSKTDEISDFISDIQPKMQKTLYILKNQY